MDWLMSSVSLVSVSVCSEGSALVSAEYVVTFEQSPMDSIRVMAFVPSLAMALMLCADDRGFERRALDLKKFGCALLGALVLIDLLFHFVDQGFHQSLQPRDAVHQRLRVCQLIEFVGLLVGFDIAGDGARHHDAA